MDIKKNATRFTLYLKNALSLVFIVDIKEKGKLWEAFNERARDSATEIDDMGGTRINIACENIMAFTAEDLDYEEYKRQRDARQRMGSQLMTMPPFAR